MAAARSGALVWRARIWRAVSWRSRRPRRATRERLFSSKEVCPAAALSCPWRHGFLIPGVRFWALKAIAWVQYRQYLLLEHFPVAGDGVADPCLRCGNVVEQGDESRRLRRHETTQVVVVPDLAARESGQILLGQRVGGDETEHGSMPIPPQFVVLEPMGQQESLRLAPIAQGAEFLRLRVTSSRQGQGLPGEQIVVAFIFNRCPVEVAIVAYPAAVAERDDVVVGVRSPPGRQPEEVRRDVQERTRSSLDRLEVNQGDLPSMPLS